MSQRVCIFCEKSKPVAKITKEHLFSRWVDEVLTPELLGPERSFERTTVSRDGVRQTRSWPTEIIAAIEAAVVCGTSKEDSRGAGCNDGWMSGLDGQVRHLLEPMMLGRPRTLTPGDQQTIAAWAAMKSMVLEYFWGSGQSIVLPQTARTFTFREYQAPASMQIRIAAVESQGRPAAIVRRVYQLRPRAADSPTLPELALCSTLVLGCFIVQAYGTSMPGPPATPQPHGRDYLAIHPPGGMDVRWPPAEALDDQGLDRFTHPLQPITRD